MLKQFHSRSQESVDVLLELLAGLQIEADKYQVGNYHKIQKVSPGLTFNKIVNLEYFLKNCSMQKSKNHSSKTL